MARFQEKRTQRKYDFLRRKEEEGVTRLLANRYNLPYVDLSVFPIELDALKIISESSSRMGELAIIRASGKHLNITLHDPNKAETKTILNRLQEDGHTYELFISSKSSLEHAWDFYKKVQEIRQMEAGTLEISHDKIEKLQSEFTNLPQVKEQINAIFTARISEALETILAGALATDASDVHIEPQINGIRLRFRLDGVLYDLAIIPPKLYNLLLSRIKLISELKLNIHDRAQDGRFTIRTKVSEIEIRTSTLPGPHGENVVLRILNPKSIGVEFNELGMQPWVTEATEVELARPTGMILTTGPTGSGKTTTLYTFLRHLYDPTIKIITIEDPIEYHLSGIEQTQVDVEKGYDFANGLRSIVRQDPDVVLVGEIRDFETAETAMHAALTGHLVFSTLHTNDAAGTIPRLIDLGVKPAIIAPALNVSMAQRLVRRLCLQCRQSAALNNEQMKITQDELTQFPDRIIKPGQAQWLIFKPNEEGCHACNHTGYKGRIGVFEMIFIDEAVERVILQSPSEFEIKREAKRQGQITLRQDALLKVLAGVTDFNEIIRVVGAPAYHTQNQPEQEAAIEGQAESEKRKNKDE